jgi:sulfopyruvate decarboxylase TPP-binding subunit
MEALSSAVPLSPVAIAAELGAAGVTDVVTVPDTHQRSLLALLARRPDPRLITVCTEDEAMGVNLGLYLGGRRPLVLIQNVGLYASMNTVRGLALDAKVPACLLIGEFGRDPAVPSAADPARSVRLLEPTLDTWGIPYYRLERPADLGLIGTAIRRAHRDRGPVAMLVGAATAAVAP